MACPPEVEAQMTGYALFLGLLAELYAIFEWQPNGIWDSIMRIAAIFVIIPWITLGYCDAVPKAMDWVTGHLSGSSSSDDDDNDRIVIVVKDYDKKD